MMSRCGYWCVCGWIQRRWFDGRSSGLTILPCCDPQDISFPLSTLSGYLSISHLTDTHPQLTTFFSGEIIGPTYGFLTGPRYYAQATEGDDMRHWSRFPHFRRIRNELRRPGLTLPEPRVDRGMGRERSFCFMRWKERFLVPDHKVRDISGASFAGECGGPAGWFCERGAHLVRQASTTSRWTSSRRPSPRRQRHRRGRTPRRALPRRS